MRNCIKVFPVALAALFFIGTGAAYASPSCSDERIQNLERKIRILERRVETTEKRLESAVNKAESDRVKRGGRLEQKIALAAERIESLTPECDAGKIQACRKIERLNARFNQLTIALSDLHKKIDQKVERLGVKADAYLERTFKKLQSLQQQLENCYS